MGLAAANRAAAVRRPIGKKWQSFPPQEVERMWEDVAVLVGVLSLFLTVMVGGEQVLNWMERTRYGKQKPRATDRRGRRVSHV